VLIAVAGTCSAGVAGIARFMAALPGASLAWPEGVFGLMTMVLMSALTLVTVWMVVRPRQTLHLATGAHLRIVEFLMLAEHHILGYRDGLRPHGRDGFVPRVRRGRLGYRTNFSRRDPQ
jgi:competence protein ComEC